jgi:hypothetical protein
VEVKVARVDKVAVAKTEWAAEVKAKAAPVAAAVVAAPILRKRKSKEVLTLANSLVSIYFF